MSATKIVTSLCLLLFSCSLHITAQAVNDQEEPTGLPGDAFSLEGALDLFKQAKSPEDFEQKLNSENYVNNLDLNEDGKIDFIRVQDYTEGEVHAFALQVHLNAKEVQDIAVIELEKTGQEDATLQILGDEDLYGEQVIVEPTEMTAVSTGKGPNVDLDLTRIIVNVWAWPSVRYVYRPSYRTYVSPYRWGTYPVRWWKPWQPRTWNACNSYRVRNYRPHYRVATTHRVVRAHGVYTPHRRTTTVIRTRTTTQVSVNKRSGRVVKGNRVVTKTSRIKGTAKNNKRAVTGKATTAKAANLNGRKVAGKKVKTSKAGKVSKGKTVSKKKTVKSKRGN